MVDPDVSRAPPLIPVQTEMEPVYYSVSMHSQNRKMRLSYSLLVEIPGTLAEGRTSIAHVRWAIDAARQMMRGHQGVDWDIQAGLYENPRIPQTTRKTAENGCHVWILNGP